MRRPIAPRAHGPRVARGWSSGGRARPLLALFAIVLTAACAANPPPAPVEPPKPTYEQKIAAILRLEDRRVIEEPAAPPPAVTSLSGLLADEEGRVRRRAALAIGRAGLAAGIEPLTGALAKDTEPEVRAMAAFGLGLIGNATAAPALVTALADPDARVQGRAAEALGLIGHAPAADAVAQMARVHLAAGVLASVAADDLTYPLAPPVEAVRLALYALVRLANFEALRTVALAASGEPASDWWPFAYALQRVGQEGAAPALRRWLTRGGALTRAFALRGLGTLKDASSRETIEQLAADARQPLAVRVQAVRALGAIADRRSGAFLHPLLRPATAGVLRLEAAAAIGQIADAANAEVLIDYLEDDWAPMRAAAQSAMARSDADSFMPVLSGLDTDPEWSVRAALAGTLAGLTPEAATPRLEQLVRDADPKVVAAALRAMTSLKTPTAAQWLTTAVAHANPAVRLAAAQGLAALAPPGASDALKRALEASRADTTYIARAAILSALATVDKAGAPALLSTALNDPDWAVRVRAATLLTALAPTATPAVAARPAPAPVEPALDAVEAMVAPPFSPQAYLQTSKGDIRIELAVLDAPRTVANFVALVRRGFFDGVRLHRVVPDFVVQGGDPRGDGEGGPGYAIRDELNERPYLRGTVGMALDWKDTGGSQFITHSPQPHLDARYTAFGQVVEGMDVVDRLEPWDLIRGVRVWDGVAWIGPAPRTR